MLGKLFNGAKVLEKSLDASWLRNEAISQNIANVDTPGYKRKTVNFEEYLNQALDNSSFKGRRTDPRHIPIGGGNIDGIEPKLTEDNKSLSYRLDGNNVDIDNEMALMAKNTIQYNALIQRINGSFRKLKSAISEGRK
ncbi:MAG: flagellar basal body rod protein FlgB [Clostridia bacterium]|nr:flagellar basal body rod protein FlgB [Clostridia bacterium]